MFVQSVAVEQAPRSYEQMPLVSVIIPAYNAASYIGHTLDSVRAQTHGNLEIIVVDDGSEDRTARVVQSLAREDQRITLLQQSNEGVAAARNAAIKASSGEYIAPLDADDIWHPQKIEKQVRCMQQVGPSVGLVYTWWISIDQAGDFVYASPRWVVEGAVYEALVSLNFIGNASIPLIRRAAIEQVGCYDDQLKAQGSQGCEDWDLSLRIAEHYQLRVVPAYLVGYRNVGGSMSGDCRTMLKSYELIMGKAKRRSPAVPENVHRWSRSHFYQYLAGVSYRGGKYRDMVYWLYKAVCSDPGAFWSPWRVQFLARGLPAAAARMVTAMWAKQYPEHHWGELLSTQRETQGGGRGRAPRLGKMAQVVKQKRTACSNLLKRHDERR